jgi:hypothetical protein
MRTLALILVLASTAFADETASVYFYRYKIFHGSASTAKAYVDAREVGKVKNGHWISVAVPAGQHKITGPNRTRGVDMVLEPGKSYYFKIEPANWNGWNFTSVTAEQGAFEIKGLKQ